MGKPKQTNATQASSQVKPFSKQTSLLSFFSTPNEKRSPPKSRCDLSEKKRADKRKLDYDTTDSPSFEDRNDRTPRTVVPKNGSDDEEDDAFKPSAKRRKRLVKYQDEEEETPKLTRRSKKADDEEQEWNGEEAEAEVEEDDADCVSEDPENSDEETKARNRGRRRSAKDKVMVSTSASKRVNGSATKRVCVEVVDESMDEADSPMTKATPKTAKSTGAEKFNKFLFTPNSPMTQADIAHPRPAIDASAKKKNKAESFKEKNQERYSWLEDIRDANKKKSGEDGYDPSTLFIPASAYAKFSEFERQFWDVKKLHWDKVVFFKKGKFYELYESDADVGHRELDLKLTDRVNMRMVGVPESSFNEWASKLIARGYKVVRVEQMERVTEVNKRKQDAKAKKAAGASVCRREVCAILTKGTLVHDNMIGTAVANYLMTIKEGEKRHTYGVCFVDTATGEFNLGSFTDDEGMTHLETLLLQTRPVEIVYEKDRLSRDVRRLVKKCLGGAPLMSAVGFGEPWDGPIAVERLISNRYFCTSQHQDSVQDLFPDALKKCMDDEVTMSAFAGCLSYLTQLKLEGDLVSLGNFHCYDTMSDSATMIIDGKSLANLELLENNTNHTVKGSLLHLIDHTYTPFGKRLLKKWLCHPLRRRAEINDRLDAVEDLNNMPATLERVRGIFTKLPDLERLLSRVHSGGRDHSTAVMFDDAEKKKVDQLLAVIDAFRKIAEIPNFFSDEVDGIRSKHLRRLVTLAADNENEEEEGQGQGQGQGQGGEVGMFPDIKRHVDFFDNAFDREQAKKGHMVPFPGIEAEFDAASAEMEAVESKLNEYLDRMRSHFHDRSIQYKQIGKEAYQLEVPNAALKKYGTPTNFQEMSATKDYKRFYSPTIKSLLEPLSEAKERKDDVCHDIIRRMLAKFDENYDLWLRAVVCVAELDCLMSLSHASFRADGPMCRANIVECSKTGAAVLTLVESRHPCISNLSAKPFIPNDVRMGGAEPPFLLVTGPNMGGKSTILRQTCICVIMAQLGMYVPAVECSLSPADRIFTRIGAQDRILAGESTFKVELLETVDIVRHATKHSLCLLDELGRGTSTFDGLAIAHAVATDLSERVGCRTLFSTHYHHLTEDFLHHPNIGCYHMDCQVEDSQQNVTFLYRFVKGSCPRSYGLNVARLAGLPKRVLDIAERHGHDFEMQMFQRRVQQQKDRRQALLNGMSDEAKECMEALFKAALLMDIPVAQGLLSQMQSLVTRGFLTAA